MPRDVLDIGMLYAALDAKRKHLGFSWRDVASRLEMSTTTFTRLGRGRPPDVHNFITILRFLGVASIPFALKEEGNLSETSVMARCTVVLRQSQDVSEEQANDLMKILQAAYRCFSKANGVLDAEEEEPNK